MAASPERPIRLLVVEDDDDDFLITERLLTRSGVGAELTRARTLAEGLEAASARAFAACLVDYRLGARTGIELIREAKARGIPTPMILLTGQGTSEADEEALRLGAADYLVKGETSPAALGRSVRYAIERQRLLTELATRKAEDEERIRSLALEQAAREEAERGERRYRALAEAIPQIVWTARPDGAFDYFNRRWFEYTAMSLEDSKGQGWQRAVHPDDVEASHARWHEAVAAGGLFEAEYRFKREADGAYRWHLARALPLRDDAGRIAKWFGTCTDVDDQKRATEARAVLLELERAARASAEKAARAKDEFLMIVSHELRTPLTVILGWAQILRRKSLSTETMAKAIEAIERNGEAQTRLIDDVLEYARLVSGEAQLDVRSLDPGSLLGAAISLARPDAEAKGITLVESIDRRPRRARLDSNQIQHAFRHLIQNGIKFTPAGGQVEISMRLAGDEAVVEIRDNGEGIAAEFLPHAFDGFRQEAHAEQRAHSGLGIGLAIVRRTVELHGGRVTAESEGPGRGATIRVVLPLIAAA